MLRLALALAAVLLAAGPADSLAQAFPQKTIKIVVPWPSGGVDLLPRTMATPMGEMLGQAVIVENRPGAGGTIGIAAVAASEPDGYTVVMTDMTSHAISASLYRKLPFDVRKDLAPIALVARSPLVLAVNPALNVKTLDEFITLVRSNPGKYNYASSGNGAITHLAMERLKRATGTNIVHVPYKGSAPAIASVIAGDTVAAFSTVPAALSNAKAGKLVLVGMTFDKPIPQLPDVPPIASRVPGYEFGLYQGVLAPAGTPPEAIAKLHAAIAKSLDDPKVRTVMQRGAFEPVLSSPEQLAQYLDGEMKTWGEVVAAVGLKIE